GADVLPDLGYNLENSETALGVLTASKDRDARQAGEVVGAIVVAALFGVATPISKHQRIRVSLIVQPAGKDSATRPSVSAASSSILDTSENEEDESSVQTVSDSGIEADSETRQELEADQPALEVPGNYIVRATFQRVVTRTD